MAVTDRAIADRIRRVVADRGPDKTCCPSEIARQLGDDDWRSLMPRVQAVARQLAADGQIVICQRGRAVVPETAQGPVRLGALRRS